MKQKVLQNGKVVLLFLSKSFYMLLQMIKLV